MRGRAVVRGRASAVWKDRLVTLSARRAAPFAFAAALLAAPASASPMNEAELAAARTSLAGNYLAGRVAGAQRDVGAAAAYFRAALKSDSRNPELLERAFLLSLAEGDDDEAMRLADRVTTVDPSNRIARLALAARAIKARSYATARSHLAQGAKGPLAELTANLIQAWSWLGSEDPGKALEAIDRLKGADFFGTFRDYHAALIADLAGRRDEAAKRFAAALSGDGTALRIVQAAAVFRARTGDKAGALQALAEFEKAAPRHPLMRQVRLAIEEGREPPRVVADVGAGVAEVLYGIGGALGRQGGEDLSTVYLQLALFVEPQHPMALVTLADLYDQLNQYQKAIEVYERVPAESPLKRNADIQSAIDLDRLDKTDEAKARLTRLIAADPTDQEAIVALGNIERGREQFAEAAETYSRAIALIEAPQPAAAAPAPIPVAVAGAGGAYVVRPGDSLWKIAADQLGDGRRWPEIQAANRAPGARRPSDADLLQPGQSIRMPTGAAGTAAPAAAAETPGSNALAAGPAAKTDIAAGQDAGSPPPADSSNWSLYYVRGIAYERSKQWPKAEADLKRALELSPEQPLVMNYLGYSWIDQGVNLDEGMKLIRRAVELRPDDGYIVDSLGWAHYRLGQFDDAVRELERAVELRPQDPVMNDHLGDAYWRVGRKIEARFQWSHAKEMEPEKDDLAKIEAKLKDGLADEKKTDSAENRERNNGG
jgi:tetratricopeptide (TPR) repeat protein